MAKKKNKPKKIKPEVLKGFKDYPAAEEIARQKLVTVFRDVFESFGFSPLQTPALERIETLKGADYGEDNLATIFNFTGPEEVDMALRFELTAPLARFVAGNPELPLPFRRYQFGTVWRVDKPGPGRFREFTQFDIDTVGTSSLLADAEIMAAICESFRRLNIDRYKVRYSNRKLLNGLAALAGVEPERAPDVFRVMDKLEKQGMKAVNLELGPGRTDVSGDKIEGLLLPEEQIETIVRFLELQLRTTGVIPTDSADVMLENALLERLKKIATGVADGALMDALREEFPEIIESATKELNGKAAVELSDDQLDILEIFLTLQDPSIPEIFDQAVRFMLSLLSDENDSNPVIVFFRKVFADKNISESGIGQYVQGLGELKQIYEYLGYMKVPSDRTEIDITIVRGLGYYTGPVFETILEDFPDFGSVFSGGRYDGLVERFLGRKIPAVGASAGVDRLLAGLIANKLIDAPLTISQVLVTAMDRDKIPEYLKVLHELRAAGISAEIFMGETKNMTKQLKYGDRVGIPIAVILGSDEFTTNQVTVKNLVAGREQAGEVTDREEWLKAEDIQVTIPREELIEYICGLLPRIEQGL